MRSSNESKDIGLQRRHVGETGLPAWQKVRSVAICQQELSTAKMSGFHVVWWFLVKVPCRQIIPASRKAGCSTIQYG